MAWRSIGTAIKEVLAPSTCSGCGERGTWLCSRCRSIWPATGELADICDRCAEPPVDGRCGCHELHPAIRRATAGFPYGGWIRPALIGAKYHGERDRAVFLGQYLSQNGVIAEIIRRADILVPVPMYLPAQLERGYNQAAVMATALAATVGCPVGHGALVKPGARESQVTLSGRQRRRNVEGAFNLAAEHGIAQGSRIVVFDDTRTTGATVSACAEALTGADVAAIDVVSVAVEYTRDQQEAAGLLAIET